MVSFILSVYSALSFVLMLGKLNSFYLHIPRGLFYGLYCYAVAQMLHFLILDYETMRHLEIHIVQVFPNLMNHLNLIFLYITLIGKMLLALTLSWMIFEARFICYIAQTSLEITEAEYTKHTFRTYLK